MITWEGKKEEIFEMPTAGAAIMRKGPNLLKLARKEQCLALGVQLRTKFKTDYVIYRIFPNGQVQVRRCRSTLKPNTPLRLGRPSPHWPELRLRLQCYPMACHACVIGLDIGCGSSMQC